MISRMAANEEAAAAVNVQARARQGYQILMARQYVPVAPLDDQKQLNCKKAFALMVTQERFLQPDKRLVLQNWLILNHLAFRHWMTQQQIAGRIRQSTYDIIIGYLVRLRQHAREQALLRQQANPGEGSAGGARKKTRKQKCKQKGGSARTNISYLAGDLYFEFNNKDTLLQTNVEIPIDYEALMKETKQTDSNNLASQMDTDFEKVFPN